MGRFQNKRRFKRKRNRENDKNNIRKQCKIN